MLLNVEMRQRIHTLDYSQQKFAKKWDLKQDLQDEGSRQKSSKPLVGGNMEANRDAAVCCTGGPVMVSCSVEFSVGDWVGSGFQGLLRVLGSLSDCQAKQDTECRW